MMCASPSPAAPSPARRHSPISVTSISLATTVYFVVGGVTGLVVARIIARHDVRLPIAGGAIAGAASLADIGHVDIACDDRVLRGRLRNGPCRRPHHRPT